MFGYLHTIIFSQLFGLFLVIMAVIMLSRVTYYRAMITRLTPPSGTVVFSAIYGLMLGLFLVIVHNLWPWQHPDVILVTVLSWLILIKSILWLALPEYMIRTTQKIYSGAGYYVMVAIAAVLGIFLMIQGFHLHLYYQPIL